MNRARVVTAGPSAALSLALAAALTPARACADAPASAPPTVSGRVIDEAGAPVAGARVRLYRRNSRWERPSAVVGEATSGPDGAFRMNTPLLPATPDNSFTLTPYALVADRAGKAVGWRNIPDRAAEFPGDITLTAPTSRTVTVMDSGGRPLAGATVAAYVVGDPSSATPEFRDHLNLRPGDGPLTAVTGADGRATLAQLPMAPTSLAATKPGFAEGYALRGQPTIRLTRGATLSGTLTGPDGAPMAGIKVVLHSSFMWEFAHAETDSEGRYRVEDLKARGWDMGGWTPGMTANGAYKLWIDDDRFAVPTESLTLEPGTIRTLDLKAAPAGAIRVTVVEEGTNRRVAGARVTAYESATDGAFVVAITDGRGQATFHALPSKLNIALVGPPEGVYLAGDFARRSWMSEMIDFAGIEADAILIMPAIAGTLVAVPGTCTDRSGTPVGNAVVSACGGQFRASSTSSAIRDCRADRAGRFTLEGVPSGRVVQLYAQAADRKLAGTAAIEIPAKADPALRAAITLVPTVAADRVLAFVEGPPLASRKFQITPVVGGEEFVFARRSVETDSEGRLKADGIVPGLAYRVVEEAAPGAFSQVIVLAPVEAR